MIVAKFDKFGPVVSEEKIFVKVYGRRMPSDEKSSLDLSGQVS